MLEDKLKEYLEQKDIVKTLNSDYREIKKEHELNDQIEKLSKELKKLRDQVKNTTEVSLIKDKKDAAKERLDLLKDILIAEMNENNQSEVVVDGQKARLIARVKFEKVQ